ncbi:dihydroneopterin aldolase [Cupriavidus sp. YAF13]|uniref:dihydroneopterin aldolase n=1 Tax=Cupriavidus sp. YAF13 TaxID=3233075 RepID=UPI003F8DDE54
MKRDDMMLQAEVARFGLLPGLMAESMAAREAPASSPGSMDLIFIEGFEGQTIIGIDDSELRTPQPLRIDLTAGLARSGACSSDRIGDTIDYGKVRTALRELMATHRLQLLEAFAERVAQLLLEDFGAHWVRVVVVKPKKFDDVDTVGVAIERRRDASPRARDPGHGWMDRGAVNV